MDAIILSGVEFYAYGGVSQEEREIGQRYRLHLELELDLAAAASSDHLEDTVSYADVHAAVLETARLRPFNLLESLAVRIATDLLDRFPVEAVAVELQKLLPPIDGVVAYSAVRVRRTRADQNAGRK